MTVDFDTLDYEMWLYKTANYMVSSTDLMHEDLVQEGRIAMWKSLERFDEDKGALPHWLTQAARGRMLDVVKGKRETGQELPARERTNSRGREARAKIRAYLAEHPRATGVQISAATGISAATVSVQRKQLDLDAEYENPTSLDVLREAGYDAPEDADLLESIVLGYMRGEVGRALDVLTTNQRRYVELRFWEGYSTTALTREFGYNPGSVWTEAKERLRPVLQELL